MCPTYLPILFILFFSPSQPPSEKNKGLFCCLIIKFLFEKQYIQLDDKEEIDLSNLKNCM